MTNSMAANIGVVGWGGRGGHVSAFANKATGGCMTPSACVEPFDHAYERGCRNYGLRPNRYHSVKEMVNKELLDGIIIASPNAFHLENMLDLAGKGIPVLLEKPLESTFEKICEIVRFTQTYKGPIMVGHCMRFAPILREAKKMIDRGDIGRICSVRFVQNCHYGSTGYRNWRRRTETSGSWLIEKATHDFDIMFWLVSAVPCSVAAVQKLHAFGGDKPNDLRCSNCPERVTCPESVQNVNFRWGSEHMVEEMRNAEDLCVWAKEVDTPDNDACLFQFDNGLIGTYTQWFFSPRSYHHRVYEIHGTEGAMEIDLGAEFGGRIMVCPRYGTYADTLQYKFDYLMRNHYNGDGPMTQHFYQIVLGHAKPETTVEQAFLAELLSYGAMQAAEKQQVVKLRDLLPEDLSFLYDKKVY